MSKVIASKWQMELGEILNSGVCIVDLFSEQRFLAYLGSSSPVSCSVSCVPLHLCSFVGGVLSSNWHVTFYQSSEDSLMNSITNRCLCILGSDRHSYKSS